MMLRGHLRRDMMILRGNDLIPHGYLMEEAGIDGTACACGCGEDGGDVVRGAGVHNWWCLMLGAS